MDKMAAWRKFSESGLITDYLDFLNVCASDKSAEAESNENEYGRSGAEGNGHGRK